MSDDTNRGCAKCHQLRSELTDVAVAAHAYYEGDYTGKVRAPTSDVVKAIEALAKKAEENDEAVIFMRTRGFVGPMLPMCKHVLRELEALCKAKNELIDERDKLIRQIDGLIAASVKVTNTMPLSCGSDQRELDHYDACGDLDQAFMAIVMERASKNDARCMARYYSLGHKQEMECQLPSGHVGMHSMAWGGSSCQWTNGTGEVRQ